MTCKTDEWTGCYDLGWGDLLIPAAYSHPAKMSRSLVFKIIAHALEEKWIQPGQWILDPFGGVGTTALPSLMSGLNYIGVELEPRFVELGRQNIALWNQRFSGLPKWTGEAVLLQGDSRRMAEVVSAAGLVVGSPPFHNSLQNSKERSGLTFGNARYGHKDRVTDMIPHDYGSTPGQLATLPPGTPPTAIVSSPPFAGNTGGRGEASRNGIDPGLFDRHSGGMKKGTGDDPANLDHLPMGMPPMAIVSSPPYADGCTHTGGNDPHPEHIQGGKRGAYGVAVVSSPPFADSVGSDDPDKRGGLFRDAKRRNDTNLTGTYGSTDGQLGGMKAGVVISSPPYEGSIINSRTHGIKDERRSKDSTDIQPTFYGDNDGQIGATQGETFWSAAALIISQCYQILPPNAYAIWVVKNYIKSGREVDFTGQWQQLCEACGFETVHVHRAMLVKENGAQGNMFGADKKNKVQRKSFFRLLFEAKQKAAKHWLTLSRDAQAAVLVYAHGLLWALYRAKLAEFEAEGKDGETPPARPSDRRILHEAQMIAWARDGKIDYEIETAINYESVLCMKKTA